MFVALSSAKRMLSKAVTSELVTSADVGRSSVSERMSSTRMRSGACDEFLAGCSRSEGSPSAADVISASSFVENDVCSSSYACVDRIASAFFHSALAAAIGESLPLESRLRSRRGSCVCVFTCGSSLARSGSILYVTGCASALPVVVGGRRGDAAGDDDASSVDGLPVRSCGDRKSAYMRLMFLRY